MGIHTQKQVNGQSMVLMDHYPFKDQAKISANMLKKNGYAAAVVAGTSCGYTGGWCVYKGQLKSQAKRQRARAVKKPWYISHSKF